MKVLVTGATGYVGGRLVGRLLAAGYRVRVFVRDEARLCGRLWREQVEVVEGDVLKMETLAAAMTDVAAAYYLIHSMGHHTEFYGRDLTAARNFGRAAREAGVRRIIFLGGLGDPSTFLSEHLRSRQRTGDVLRESGVPVTEFRAAIIVGSGSISFEMIRYLVERMPVLLCPAWAYTSVQPIAVRNVLQYLVAALETPASAGEIIEIGGADVTTYADMMAGYGRVRGLRRASLPLPSLPPTLCAKWVHWLTPIPYLVARPLIEGMVNEVVVRDDKAARLFPDIHPFDCETAVRRALMRLDAGQVETAWSDALVSTLGDVPPVVLTDREGMIIDRRQLVASAPAEVVYQTATRLGGERGWLYFNWAWLLRGGLDRLMGGVGSLRGRRFSDRVQVGDAVDFWRVEDLVPGRRLRLRSEMKLPGQAWLEFEARPLDENKTRLVQRAYFAPKGVPGLLYWYLLYPIHQLIFSGLIRKLVERAEVACVEARKRA